MSNHPVRKATRHNRCDYLRVVLFCKGAGADKDTYRPGSDESQWWGRRDALVRCVASFLFGANASASNKELVLLFDDDLARLHMSIGGGDRADEKDNGGASVFPKEQTIIQLWKRAAQNLRKPVHLNGMTCTIHLDPALSLKATTPSSNSGSGRSANHGSIEQIDTKRAVLEYIQKHVSMDFLREHKINSHPEVVLRKTNKQKLLKIWQAWTKQSQTSTNSADESDDENDGNGRRLRTIYRNLLEFPLDKTPGTGGSSPEVPRVVAGTLHETSEEFPCFGPQTRQEDDGESSGASYRVCLFLGAVRDMTSREHDILGRVCGASNIPLVGVRFGTVPEFTSKILSLLAFHHANHVLDASLKRLLVAAGSGERLHRSRSTAIEQQQQQQHQQSTCLSIVCTVPTHSTEISIDGNKRDEIHWRLVRVIVCSLWRSKLVSSKSQVGHANVLHLVFGDGVVVTLNEREFVGRLADQHQAAPSEFQILTALIHEIKHQSRFQTPPVSSKKQSSDGSDRGWSRKKLAKRLVKKVLESSTVTVTSAIGIESSAPNEIVSRFYDGPTRDNALAPADSDRGVLMALYIAPATNHSKGSLFDRLQQRQDKAEEQHKHDSRKMYREIISASRKLQIPTIEQNVIPNRCWDREAASIIALQQMCYQNRVFATRCTRSRNTAPPKTAGEKRKKPI